MVQYLLFTDLKTPKRNSETQRLTELNTWACHSTHSSKLAEPSSGEIQNSLQLGENNRTLFACADMNSSRAETATHNAKCKGHTEYLSWNVGFHLWGFWQRRGLGLDVFLHQTSVTRLPAHRTKY